MLPWMFEWMLESIFGSMSKGMFEWIRIRALDNHSVRYDGWPLR